MTWVKLDDGFYRNRKARQAGKDGRALFLAGLCHCSNALTDGHIGTYDLPVIAAEAEVKAAVAGKLVEVGLWLKVADGWLVHDYKHYNRPADTVRKERDDGRERAARSRERRRNEDGTFGGTDDRRSSTPSSSSSSPLGVSSVSESSSSKGAAIGDEDDWATVVAKRRLVQREAEKGRVTRVRGWIKTTVSDVLDEHEVAAQKYQANHPSATSLEVANYVEPPVGGLRVVVDKHPDCPDCHGSGWVEDSDPVVRCTHQREAS